MAEMWLILHHWHDDPEITVMPCGHATREEAEAAAAFFRAKESEDRFQVVRFANWINPNDP